MTPPILTMTPAPGERLVRFVGDVITFRLVGDAPVGPEEKFTARLRTTIGRGRQLREEIRRAHFHKLPPAGAAWRDLEMKWADGAWVVALPLAEVGFFRAKAYLLDEPGWQHWPDGPDFGVNVQPNWCRTANIIYCAFPRMFGPNKTKAQTIDEPREAELKQLDAQGYTVIPPSGTLRDVIRELPHIFDTLGCRILHLLPVSPTPTTLAKFGRFGSPYAVQDLTAIDPALIEFDQRTTGVEQFVELAEAVHLRDGRLMLDVVINHTGWHSTLFERHPEWFVKGAGGRFVSPGAWGTTWEDLVEIDPSSSALWEELAEVFLTWCRRGVDGFRCDAGYKVPVLVWQYITARVHAEFPETVFFLEGLGGGWDDTAIRLTEGGMQWAYSEIFQNYTPAELCGYLDHAWNQSERVGLLLNYSETHDNDRLAAKGREWSLLRNQLCALTSVCGGFGFTSGVEWLAPEKVNVHSARGLAWGSEPNIVAELGKLNRLLAEHPCFFDGARVIRLSQPDDAVFAFLRISASGDEAVLVLANLDLKLKQRFAWKPLATDSMPAGVKELGRGKLRFTSRATAGIEPAELTGLVMEAHRLAFAGRRAKELLTGQIVTVPGAESDQLTWSLLPASILCLQVDLEDWESAWGPYRANRARAAFAVQAALVADREAAVASATWTMLAMDVQQPVKFLADLAQQSKGGVFVPVIHWTSPDQRRVLPVPPEHWLLVVLPDRFRLSFRGSDGSSLNLHAVPGDGEWFAAIPPGQPFGDAQLMVEAYRNEVIHLRGEVRFLKPLPEWQSQLADIALLSRVARDRTVLLTNGRGGMARINLDLGRVRSKYDCVLAANLNDELPVDRHVSLKRLRVWANASGFISPLSADNLVRFQVEPQAEWLFRVPAGDGRAVFVRLRITMLDGENTVRLSFCRERSEPRDGVNLRLTVRFDLEDRNFHWETKRNGAAEHHFSGNTRPLSGTPGFEFTPAADRVLRVAANAGTYHAAPEWSEHLPHPVEASRGQTGEGDGWSPGWFDLPLHEDGAKVEMVATAESSSTPTLGRATLLRSLELSPQDGARQEPRPTGVTIVEDEGRERAATAFEQQLHRAAAQFIVRRGDFKSVIAGYPWFLDWGRDTLICARGLIAGGWLEEVKQLLIVFGRFEQNGTLPNTIHGNDASNRDTSDAPLWYGVVAEELAAATDERVFALKVDASRTVLDVLVSIATGYFKGTANGIRVDPASGLVWSPSHFTWMDTNYPAGTPREGYPIEIQSLWIRLFRLLARLKAPTAGDTWSAIADRVAASLEQLYWLEARGWFADSLIAQAGVPAANAVPDQVLRSNCLIPISFGQLTGDRARRCVEAARQHLVVPGALRSLAPLPVEPPLPIHGPHGGLLNDPANPYWGRYEGDEDTRRKPAYHNGTAWTWTFPAFCEALAVAHEHEPAAIAAARAYLGSMDRLLAEGCFGQLPEVIDGDAPHAQRGCDAQAWGATEALRVWRRLDSKPA
jgi:starch synthase (maltosyl-transferring)